MPSPLTQRDQLRADLASRTTDFLAGGGCIEPVGFRMKDVALPKGQYGRTSYKEPQPTPAAAPTPAPAEQRPASPAFQVLIEAAAAELAEETATPARWEHCDQQLAVQLLVEASLGNKLTPTARKLGVPLSRCRRVARLNRIEFRR